MPSLNDHLENPAPKIVPQDEADILISYLYGDVTHLDAVVHWEYGRFERGLLSAAKMLKESKTNVVEQFIALVQLRRMEVADALIKDPLRAHRRSMPDDLPDWIFQLPWLDIWSSPFFPDNYWLELELEERKSIAAMFRPATTTSPAPLPVADVRLLAGMGYFDEWTAESKRPQSGRLGAAPARIRRDAIEQVIFTIDYSDACQTVAGKFAAWLEQPTQRALFKRYKVNRRGREKGERGQLTMLRFLAIRRLFQGKRKNSDCTKLACLPPQRKIP